MMKIPDRLIVWVCLWTASFGIMAPDICSARQPICETETFRQCLKKPKTEFSKMVCLLNMYRDADFTIRFDGADYAPSFVHPYAKIYLFTHYNKETAAQWAKKYCYISPFAGDIIYVKHPDGRYEIALDMILRDLAELEKALQQEGC